MTSYESTRNQSRLKGQYVILPFWYKQPRICKFGSPSLEMSKKINWFSIKEFIEIDSLLFIYKFRLNLLATYFEGVLKSFPEIHNHDTKKKIVFFNSQEFQACSKQYFFKAGIKYISLAKKVKLINLKKIQKKII